VWDSQRADAPRLLREQFVPVILDSYLTGTPAEKAFVDRLGRGGTNCIVIAAASGKRVGTTVSPGELTKLLQEYRALPESDRKPKIEEESGAVDPARLPPELPKGGLSLIVYQVSLGRAENGEYTRLANVMAPGPSWNLKVPLTMNDLIWGTAEESRALIPAGAQKGQKIVVPPSLFKRVAMTQAYDWMLGYQNDWLPLREGELVMTVDEVTAKEIRLHVEGFSKVGGTEEQMRACTCERQRGCSHWGCDLQYYGVARIDRARQSFSEFRVVGIGNTWSKVKRADLSYGSQVVRYPTGILLDLPSDVPANRRAWPPLAPQRLSAGFDYWSASRR
jgi:hypothetical protein